ncbi:MAG: DUF5050 domain-containing protein [Ruminococcaceae bacterium]|nr:DUF5050 domain-containing protein [Oscillospiraceae bacterium]
MKKVISIILSVVLLCSFLCSCEDKTNTSAGDNTDIGEVQETGDNKSDKPSNEREPMPTYEKLGVNNSIATTDGRYIYYTYTDTKSSEGKLLRMNMEGQNPEELWKLSNGNFSDLYINDGYLYLSYGRTADRIDIATAPNYFKGANGYVANESIIDSAEAKKFFGISQTCADDEYIYFEATGIYRVKKDTTGLERIVYDEDFVNFYDIKVSDGYLYAYCGDDQKLYRINADGSNATEICKPMESHVIYGDYVYYIVSGDGHIQTLTKTKLDASETTTVATLNEGSGNVTILNAMDNKIYYSHREDNAYTLKAYDISSSTISNIYEFEDSIKSLDIVGDYLFIEQNNILMKMNIDGTGLQQLGQ